MLHELGQIFLSHPTPVFGRQSSPKLLSDLSVVWLVYTPEVHSLIFRLSPILKPFEICMLINW